MVGYITVPFKPQKPETDQNRFVGRDGWEIVRVSDKYIFGYPDCGHGGRVIRIEVKKEDDDFARKNNPSWEEIVKRLSLSGRFKEID